MRLLSTRGQVGAAVHVHFAVPGGRILLATVLALSALGVPSARSGREVAEIPEALARVLSASHLDQLGSKTRIAFTFHLRVGEREIDRRWDWSLTTDAVRLDGNDVGKTPQFINDSYWLLFHAMVAWDLDKVKIEAHGGAVAPLSGRQSTEIAVLYCDGSGATPNDLYRLYVDGDSVIEWAYHKAGAAEPTRQTTWEGYETVGGLRLSLDRKGDGFHVWFTDVVVE